MLLYNKAWMNEQSMVQSTLARDKTWRRRLIYLSSISTRSLWLILICTTITTSATTQLVENDTLKKEKQKSRACKRGGLKTTYWLLFNFNLLHICMYHTTYIYFTNYTKRESKVSVVCSWVPPSSSSSTTASATPELRNEIDSLMTSSVAPPLFLLLALTASFFFLPCFSIFEDQVGIWDW